MTNEPSTGMAQDSPSGPAAAAILAAASGCFALGLFSLAADTSPAINRSLALYVPSGALSGVTTSALAVWLAVWLVLGRRWAHREVRLATVIVASGAFVALAVLLTFPPFIDLLQG